MPSASTDRGRLVFWLQAASLTATAWVVWRFSVAPRLHSQSLGALAAHALVLALAAALWGAVITLVLLFAIAHLERGRAWHVTLRTSAAAIWFAPATILLSASSPIYLAAALALVITATRLLYAQWRESAPPVLEPVTETPHGVLAAGGIATGLLPRSPWMALSAGLAVQATLAAWGMGASGMAAAFFSLAAAILTVFATASGVLREERPTLPESAFGFILTFLLAAGLMFTGLGGGGWGAGPGKGGEQTANGDSPKRTVAYPPNYGLAKSGDFPGVILRPEKRPVPLLVEPIPISGKIAGRRPDRPFSIPFDGEYWMYRWPFPSPPAGSYIYQGSPTTVSYRSVDELPLRMDAHQLLDREIDLSCCRAIQIEILNADTHPNTVLMELTIADRGARPVSLGVRPVTSHPDGARTPVAPVLETLEYPATAMNFDEIKVSFQRKHVRAGRSARIAINRFLLIPR